MNEAGTKKVWQCTNVNGIVTITVFDTIVRVQFTNDDGSGITQYIDLGLTIPPKTFVSK